MAELTSTQLSEWEAYNKLDPIGQWRYDYNTAQLSLLITNIVNALYHDPKKGDLEEHTIQDYMPIWDKENEVEDKVQSIQTPEQMRDAMMSIAKMQNARVKNKRNTPPVRLRREK